jgi:hypothetical protein
MTVFVMSIWAIVSAIIIITSKNKVQILMGRILNYVYVVRNTHSLTTWTVANDTPAGHGTVGHQRFPGGAYARSDPGFRGRLVPNVHCEATHMNEGEPELAANMRRVLAVL